ncbi:mCG147112 [Mus musculus]|nr:mCG147112 [Mus musculus]
MGQKAATDNPEPRGNRSVASMPHPPAPTCSSPNPSQLSVWGRGSLDPSPAFGSLPYWQV